MQIASASTASGLPWVPRAADMRRPLAMAQQHGISELLAGILAGRDVALDDVPKFLNPTLRDYLPDPFHLRDMDKAVARLMRALDAGEPIAVFGDYDVDGATSTALLHRYFSALGVAVRPYIPDRMKEGYGPTVEAFAALIDGQVPPPSGGRSGGGPTLGETCGDTPPANGGEAMGMFHTASSVWGGPPPNLPPMGGGINGASLIITVDCGTLAHAPIAYAASRGVDVIVLDHHLSSGELPEAYALVNPNRFDETSPHRHLAAVGVTFLLLVALNKSLREAGYFETAGSADAPESSGENGRRIPRKEPDLLALLDMVALGTVCDVMPLTGLNRAFVAQGLKVMAQRGNLGLSVLADVARLNELPNVYHLGFLLGPRINAGGRVGASGLGVALLTATEELDARAVAQRLDTHNAERQAIEQGLLERAMDMAAVQDNLPVMMVAGEGWHQGVIGIIAGRLKERFQRPAVVIALDQGMGKASARSVAGVDMGAAVHAAVTHGLIEKGGGHAMAAGFSLRAEAITDLHDFFIARMGEGVAGYQEARVMKFDGFLSVAGATLATLDDIARAGPYGLGNPGPRFVIHGASILHRTIMKEKHLRLTVGDQSGKAKLNAVAFGAVGSRLGEWLMNARYLHLMGELKRNLWQGQESVQWMIDDAAEV